MATTVEQEPLPKVPHGQNGTGIFSPPHRLLVRGGRTAALFFGG